VTANQDQIQRLLTEVQEVLAQGNPRLPWGSAAQIARQRQVLEQIRTYLQEALFHLSQNPSNQAGKQVQDVMQAVIEEMNALRSTLLRPLHSEVATLMQQRTALTREIRQLEAHRQLLEQSASTAVTPSSEKLPVEKLQVVHDRADQVLTTLDTTLHVVCESLQNDLQAYQDSLAQGIDKLHSLGQQSEVMFAGMVGRLATQMGREASALSQESSEPAVLTPAPLAMPYAGTELTAKLRREPLQTIPSIDSITVLTELIDQLVVKVDESSKAVPVTSPRNGSSRGHGVSSELKALFQADLPNVVPAIESNGYSGLDQETGFDQLEAPDQSSVFPTGEVTIFTLEGIDSLFADEAEDHLSR
jgi:hypothetical protein